MVVFEVGWFDLVWFLLASWSIDRRLVGFIQTVLIVSISILLLVDADGG